MQSVLTQSKIVNMIDLQPSITYSTDNLKLLDVSQRDCYLPHERDLLNFNKYNHHNCIIECRMNLTLRLCGCVPFIYFNEEGTYPKVRLCDLTDVYCLTNYFSKYN